MPVIAPEPLMFIVPVLVKPANNVVVVPEPERLIVPELVIPPDVVTMEHVPPRFNTLEFVNDPVAPANAVFIVSVPLLVLVPVTVT